MGRSRRARSRLPRTVQYAINPLVLVILISAWLGQSTWEVIAIASALALAYFLFAMLRVCSARNVDGTFCANDAQGLLRGCRSFRRHRVQARWRLVPERWRPRSVQRNFDTKAEQRARAGASPMRASTPPSGVLVSTAAASGGAQPVAASSLDLLALLEVIFSAGSFVVSVVALVLA